MTGCSVDSNIIEWSVPHTESLYDLLSLKNESSGEFVIDTQTKKTSSKITKLMGSESSVEAPLALVNYHTHPASCYVSEHTVWGFPSGEDTRESILFGLKGSIAHLVIAVEGTYVCQINPKILYALINIDIPKESVPQKVLKTLNKIMTKNKASLNDIYRGLIVQCVEVYFRSTHAFRTKNFTSSHPAVNPVDYINFCNNFTFLNIFGKSTHVDGCTNIKCDKIWVYENNKLKQLNFPKYIDDYEHEEHIYVCDPLGNVVISDENYSKFVAEGGLKPLESYFRDDKWFMFQLFPHKVQLKDNQVLKFFIDLPHKTKTEVIQAIADKNPAVRLVKYKDPKFLFYNMNGRHCSHNTIRDKLHKRELMKNLSRFGKESDVESDIKYSKESDNKETKEIKETGKSAGKLHVLVIGSSKCGYCERLVDYLKKNHYNVTYNCYDDIGAALASANKHYKSIGHSFGRRKSKKKAKRSVKKKQLKMFFGSVVSMSSDTLQTIPALFYKNKLIDHNHLMETGRMTERIL
jgi:hypothetical protein